MKITILSDVNVAATAVAYFLLQKNPDIDRSSLATASCPLAFSTNTGFEFPRNLGFSSLPRTEPVKTKPFSFDSTIGGRTRRDAQIDLQHIAEETITGSGSKFFSSAFRRLLPDTDLVEQIRTSQQVFLVYSQDPHGAHKARILRDWVSQHGINPEYTYVEYGDPIDHHNFQTALENPLSQPDLEAKSTPSLIEQYFEFNYLLNSLPIMTATSMKALGRNVGNALSHDLLQILFHLHGHSGIDLRFFVRSLVNWRGTGRHEGTVQFGWGDGSTTDDPSVSLLEKEGLADIRDDKRIVITDDGLKLLGAIHPDCRDVDQKHRLRKWMTLSEAAARGKIDQYIKTFFGKQLRHLKI